MKLVTILNRVLPKPIKNVILDMTNLKVPRNQDYIKRFGLIHLWTLNDPYYFIHIPKCAGNSIDKYLTENHIATMTLGHSVISESYEYPYDVSRPDNSRAFCVVRNPLFRTPSAYFFLKQGGMHEEDAKIYHENLSQYSDFKDFVINGLGNRTNRESILQVTHFIPQSNFLLNKNGQLCVARENILYFENLHEGFANYLKSRGKKIIGFPWENKTNGCQDYSGLYRLKNGEWDFKMITIVLDAYKKDFEFFEFSRELS